MIGMVIIFDTEHLWPDLQNTTTLHLDDSGASAIQVAVIDKGLVSGRPSLALRFDLSDGKTVIAETTARLFCSAARAIMAKYPDLFEGD